MRSNFTRRIILSATALGLGLVCFVVLANDTATWVVQSFISGNRVIHNKGLSGAGQIVTMVDAAPWGEHEALRDPNRPFSCQDPNSSVGPLHRKLQGWISVCASPQCKSPHGTHAAGSIAGDAPTSSGAYNTWNGMDGHAYNARLVVVDTGPAFVCSLMDPIDPNLYSQSLALGSRIVSNAFVTDNGSGANYCQSASVNDQFVLDHKDYLIVAPVGNEGSRTCSGSSTKCSTDSDCPPPAVCAGFSKIRCEAQAKNIISVGASNISHEAAEFSSWGPTADGRLKPTLMAPGEDICSAVPQFDPAHETCVPAAGICSPAGTPCSTQADCPPFNECVIDVPPYCDPSGGPCNDDDDCPLLQPLCLPGNPSYREQSGTSFAHPVVSGSAALVREYFTNGWYPSGTQGGSPALAPSAALLKAVMINGAVEMTGDSSYISPTNRRYPNTVQGWGRLHLDNALYFNGDSRKLAVCQDKAGLTNAGQQRQVTVNVASSTQPIEVTLVWTDPPRVPYNKDAIQLVNDLDLVVADPNVTQYKGNVFVGANPGQSATGGTADRLNVEENVLRITPGTGNWVATVSAYGVPSTAQPFALAITGNMSLVAGAYVGASADHATGPGTIFQNNYLATLTSNNTREVLRETSGGLSHTWRFDNIPCGSSRHKLHLEGYRPFNSDADDFQFYYSTDGVNFTEVPSAIIGSPQEIPGGWDYEFDDAGLMGTVYIRVNDTAVGGGFTLDKVYIDHLEIR